MAPVRAPARRPADRSRGGPLPGVAPGQGRNHGSAPRQSVPRRRNAYGGLYRPQPAPSVRKNRTASSSRTRRSGPRCRTCRTGTRTFRIRPGVRPRASRTGSGRTGGWPSRTPPRRRESRCPRLRRAREARRGERQCRAGALAPKQPCVLGAVRGFPQQPGAIVGRHEAHHGVDQGIAGLADHAGDLGRGVRVGPDLLALDADPSVGVLPRQLVAMPLEVLQVGAEPAPALVERFLAAERVHQFADALLGHCRSHALTSLRRVQGSRPANGTRPAREARGRRREPCLRLRGSRPRTGRCGRAGRLPLRRTERPARGCPSSPGVPGTARRRPGALPSPSGAACGRPGG